MTSEGTDSGHLRLPWLVLGPRSQGRNYGVIGRTQGLRLSRQAENRLDDFSLALAAWADVAGSGRPEAFACFFSLGEGEPWFLVRGRFMGRVGLGTVANALGVILPAELAATGQVKPHRLIARIPEPQNDTAPPPPLDVASAVQARSTDLGIAGLNLQSDNLNSHLLAIEDDGARPGEKLVAAILDGPSAPDGFKGWADTGSLSRNGAFDPAENFALIVHRPGDAPPPQTRLPRFRVVIRGNVVVENGAPTSPARAVWIPFLDAALRRAEPGPIHDALARLEWRPDMAGLSATEIVDRIVREATVGLDINTRLELFILLAGATDSLSRSADIQIEARTGLAEAYRRLHEIADTGLSAVIIDTYVSKIRVLLDDVAPRAAAVDAIGYGVLPLLAPATLRVLSKNGLLTSMAAKTWPAVCASLGRGAKAPPFSPEGLAALMDMVSYHLEFSKDEMRPESYGLATDLLEEGARLVVGAVGATARDAPHRDRSAAWAGPVTEAQYLSVLEEFRKLAKGVLNGGSAFAEARLSPVVARALKVDEQPRVGKWAQSVASRFRARFWARAKTAFRNGSDDPLTLSRIGLIALDQSSQLPWEPTT